MRRIVLLALLIVNSTKAETYLCVMEKSSVAFKYHTIFEVNKNGDKVQLTGLKETGESSDDYWSYTVLAENKEVGFRAYRSISPKGDDIFNIAIGGELQLVKYKGIHLSITYSNTIAGTGGMASLECEEI